MTTSWETREPAHAAEVGGPFVDIESTPPLDAVHEGFPPEMPGPATSDGDGRLANWLDVCDMRLDAAQANITRVVQQHPLAALAVAAGVGVVLANLVRPTRR
jgi:hypothetical protein